jgi:thiol-disulfide isomerase/thioredoxin
MAYALNKKHAGILCKILLLLLLVHPVYADDVFTNAVDAANPSGEDIVQAFSYANTTVHVFYSTHCGACHKVLPVIEETALNHPDISVIYYDMDLSDENLTAFFDFAEHHNISFPSYPAIFTGDTIVIEGLSEINSSIEEIFQGIEDGLIPDPEYEKKWYTEPIIYTYSGPGFEYTKPELNLYLVLTAGLLDGINPCAFAVLVFLLISLMTAGSKKKVLSIGFSYITAVFLF